MADILLNIIDPNGVKVVFTNAYGSKIRFEFLTAFTTANYSAKYNIGICNN